MKQQRVHQFTTSGWLLIVTTFALGYVMGHYDFQIQEFMNLILVWLGGSACYSCNAAPC